MTTNLWRGLAALLAAGLAVNGALMLAAPAGWYAGLPGVSATGSFNPHFVRDIGAAYLAAALASGWAGWRGGRAAMLPAAGFLGLHALIHLFEAGHAGGTALAVELTGVYLPALLALGLALPLPSAATLARLAPAALIERQVAAAEARLGVPLDYMREIGRTAPALLAKFGTLAGLGRHDGATPVAALQFAVLGAVQVDDCGECLQIHVNLARQAGVAAADLQAALDNRLDDLPALSALALRFGRAAAENAPALAELAARLEAQIGRRAMFDLGIALGLARFYPVLKRALGYAVSCRLVQVKAA
jgi:AhpD family alkylhydroperoxidase